MSRLFAASPETWLFLALGGFAVNGEHYLLGSLFFYAIYLGDFRHAFHGGGDFGGPCGHEF